MGSVFGLEPGSSSPVIKQKKSNMIDLIRSLFIARNEYEWFHYSERRSLTRLFLFLAAFLAVLFIFDL